MNASLKIGAIAGIVVGIFAIIATMFKIKIGLSYF